MTSLPKGTFYADIACRIDARIYLTALVPFNVMH